MKVIFYNHDFYSKKNEIFKQCLKSKSENILWVKTNAEFMVQIIFIVFSKVTKILY